MKNYGPTCIFTEVGWVVYHLRIIYMIYRMREIRKNMLRQSKRSQLLQQLLSTGMQSISPAKDAKKISGSKNQDLD